MASPLPFGADDFCFDGLELAGAAPDFAPDAKPARRADALLTRADNPFEFVRRQEVRRSGGQESTLQTGTT